jgi:hypothetical protein
MKILDSGFRRNDEKNAFGTFYEIIKVWIGIGDRGLKYGMDLYVRQK